MEKYIYIYFVSLGIHYTRIHVSQTCSWSITTASKEGGPSLVTF